MSWNKSLSGVIEDPDFTRPIVWRAGKSVDSTGDGSTEYRFDNPVEMELLVVSPDASPLERNPEGPSEPVEYALCAMLDRGITHEDRIIFDDARGESTPYRVGAPEVTEFDGDRFAWYGLRRDHRGDSSDEESDGYPTR